MNLADQHPPHAPDQHREQDAGPTDRVTRHPVDAPTGRAGQSMAPDTQCHQNGDQEEQEAPDIIGLAPYQP
jgi:hypothetical protein